MSLINIAVIFAALWFIGVVTSHTFGGFIHVLLAIAFVLILVRAIRGRAMQQYGTLDSDESNRKTLD